jgi:ABC-type uncharacterized transport system ATPase subunit
LHPQRVHQLTAFIRIIGIFIDWAHHPSTQIWQFFLQLKASALLGKNNVFLLDEPGANLHEKAQSDVLSLIEKIKEQESLKLEAEKLS